MLRALFQQTKRDHSRGDPIYGHVYPILKDGTHSESPIFYNIRRDIAEQLFDELVEYHLHDYAISQARCHKTGKLFSKTTKFMLAEDELRIEQITHEE